MCTGSQAWSTWPSCAGFTQSRGAGRKCTDTERAKGENVDLHYRRDVHLSALMYHSVQREGKGTPGPIHQSSAQLRSEALLALLSHALESALGQLWGVAKSCLMVAVEPPAAAFERWVEVDPAILDAASLHTSRQAQLETSTCSCRSAPDPQDLAESSQCVSKALRSKWTSVSKARSPEEPRPWSRTRQALGFSLGT